MSECQFRSAVERHFAGTISPLDERAMRSHLGECAACRAYYQRHRLLSQLDPTAMPAEDRIAKGLGFAVPVASPGPQRSRIVVAAAVLTLAAAIALIVGHRSREDASGFTARGDRTDVGAPRPRLFVYRVRDGGAPVRAETSLTRGDELAFAYENPSAMTSLMVFGVDDRRRVYWFHPAWDRAEDDPPAVAIANDGVRHELPEAVKQPFEGTRLEIHAVFATHPLTVRQVEDAVSHSRGDLTIPDVVHETMTFDLEAR